MPIGWTDDLKRIKSTWDTNGWGRAISNFVRVRLEEEEDDDEEYEEEDDDEKDEENDRD